MNTNEIPTPRGAYRPEAINMNEMPTPETNAAIKTIGLYRGDEMEIIDPEFARDLERRLTIARGALEKCLGWTHRALELEISGSMSEAQSVDIKSAREALDLTAPKP